MTDYTATYSPDDNHLRIRRNDGKRLPDDHYNRVRGAGYIWAPAQKLFVRPAWTPEAEDAALELAGSIGDEDSSLMDRAEVRAERFEGYSEKRGEEAHRVLEAVSVHPAYVAGGPIHVGHHNARRAEKEKEKLEGQMQKAAQLWDTSEYWTRRAKGAIRHAKYKELPAVRARRIKKLGAEQRKYERSREKFAGLLEVYTHTSWDGKLSKNGQTYRRALLESFDGGLSFDDRQALEKGTLPYDEALARAIAHCTRWMNHDERNIKHLDMRLSYERVMLEDQGASDLIADKPRPKPLPLCNYRTPEVIVPDRYHRGQMETLKQTEMTSAAYAKIPTDLKGTRIVDGSHRVRVAMIRRPGAAYFVSDTYCVFLTDSKVHDRPKPAPEPDYPECHDRAPQFETRVYTPPQRTQFDDLKDSLREGVKAFTAPQLLVTPPDLADRVIAEADIRSHHRALEPNAGTGNLLRRINAQECVAVEINQQLAHALASQFPQVTVRQADFLECSDLGTFDRIVMNPPFANGQDIKHVSHALRMLRPGGRLVAIMSAGVTFRDDAAHFRAMVEERGGCIEPLPEGSFKESGTNVNTVLLTLSVQKRADLVTTNSTRDVAHA